MQLLDFISISCSYIRVQVQDNVVGVKNLFHTFYDNGSDLKAFIYSNVKYVVISFIKIKKDKL